MYDGLPFHADDVPAFSYETGELVATHRRLGAAAGAERIGVALIDVAPGKRSSPPHSHIDEEEQFFVIAGSGVSYQTSGSKDVRARTRFARATSSGTRPAETRTRCSPARKG